MMLALKDARILGAARLAAGACALILLAGCGQKGPLRLPSDLPGQANTPSRDAPAAPEPLLDPTTAPTVLQ